MHSSDPAENSFLKIIKEYLYGSDTSPASFHGQPDKNLAPVVKVERVSARRATERSPTRGGAMPMPQEMAGVDKDLFNSTGFYVGLDAIKSPPRARGSRIGAKGLSVISEVIMTMG